MTLTRSDVPGFPVTRGKVRDVYDLGDTLALVATDRVSAFDWVLDDGIPGKGAVLTSLSEFWFRRLGVPSHFLSCNLYDLPPAFHDKIELAGRTMLVRKTEVIPFECVARGYLAGSGWNSYRATGRVCGVELLPGLSEGSRLPEPIFTPATKAELGSHDENVPLEVLAQALGAELAGELQSRTLDIYRRAADYAIERGIILADTKLEWGVCGGELLWIDEALTPDSSRFWPAADYRPGASPPSFDKQFLRDYLESSGWDKASAPPKLPADIVAATAARYQEARARLMG